MANPWFRLYAEFAADPKVQSMPEVMQRRLVMLFCDACRDESVTVCDGDRAFHWRVTGEQLAETKALFVRKGFCDSQWNLKNWEKRQFAADSSKERTKRWRERQTKKTVTVGDGHGDVTTRRCDGLEQNRTEQNKRTCDEVTDPSIATRVLLESCGLSKTRAFLEAVGDQAALAKKNGEDLKAWAEGAIAAYLAYQEAKPQLDYPLGAEKFFATGLYRRRQDWKYKPGAEPAPKRKYYSPEVQ